MAQGPVAGDSGRYRASWDDHARLAAMTAVAGLGRQALALDEPASLMKHAVADVAETMGMPMVVLTELDPGGDKWVVLAGFGWRPGVMDAGLLWEAPELVSLALGTASPVVMGDIAEETRWSTPSDVLADHGVTSGICVPVVGWGEPRGVLAVFDRVRRAFGPVEVEFITMVGHVLGLAMDRYRREEEVRHDAVHDPLTGLANRVLLGDRIDMIVHEFHRTGRRAALLLLDLDGFKNINDTLGHQAGDAVLKRIGERLTSVVRQTDTVARLGGDEFAIVMREAGRREAETVAGKVCDVIAQPLDLDGRPQVRASVGIALVPDSGSDADALLAYADVEMLRAKKLSHALDGTLFNLLESDSIDRLIAALMSRDESSSLEFKSSARWNLHTKGRDEDLELQIVKTVAAFMNAGGGMLLIGVSDDHRVVGLENDYKLLSKKDRDGFGLWMTDLLRKCLGDAVAAGVSVRFGRVDHHEVCLVNAPSHAGGPVFVYPGKDRAAEFWLRMNNSTRHLDVEDALEYINSHPLWSTPG